MRAFVIAIGLAAALSAASARAEDALELPDGPAAGGPSDVEAAVSMAMAEQDIEVPAAFVAGAAAEPAAAQATLAAAEPPALKAADPAIRDLPGFLRLADGWMLAGRMAPPELPRLLQALAPADRLTAIAYLRRGGLYEGPAMDLGALLTAEAAP